MEGREDDPYKRPPLDLYEGNCDGATHKDEGNEDPEPCLKDKVKKAGQSNSRTYVKELPQGKRPHDLVFGFYKLGNLELHYLEYSPIITQIPAFAGMVVARSRYFCGRAGGGGGGGGSGGFGTGGTDGMAGGMVGDALGGVAVANSL